MTFALYLLPDMRFGDGALLAGLIVVALVLGARMYGGVRHLCGVGERLRIAGTSPLARLLGFADRGGRVPLCRLIESRARYPGRGRGRDLRAPDREARPRAHAAQPRHLRARTRGRFQPAFARALSLLVAIAGLIVLAPVMAVIALAIKRGSRGPVFFGQQRIGLYRMSFNLFKFRTMHPVGGRHYEWERDQEVEKIRYDFYSLKHRSVWLDLRILFETVWIVVSGHREIPAELETPRETVEARAHRERA